MNEIEIPHTAKTVCVHWVKKKKSFSFQSRRGLYEGKGKKTED